MAIGFVVAQSAGGNSTTVTTSGVNTSGATLLVMVVTGFNPPSATPTDSNSNEWIGTTAQSATRFYYSWRKSAGVPLSVGSGHTFTWNEAVFAGIAVLAFSGTDTSADPLDTRVGNSASTSPGSITPAVSSELFVATDGGDGSAWDAMTESTGFTLPTNGRVAYVGSTTEAAQGWYKIGTTTSAENPIFSVTGWANQIAFKPGAGGGGGRTTKNTRAFPLGMAIGMHLGEPGVYSGPMLRHNSGLYVPERMAA